MARTLRAATDERVSYVERADALDALCDQLARAARFAIDTEFVGERSYAPALELIQVATGDRVALIDCRAVERLEPVFALLADPGIEKVFHAGQQDLELFQTLSGRAPATIVDTQVAAAMLGYGAQIGYAQLVERVLGTAVDKSETLTDWSRRPLTAAQLAYAADDVRHLLPLYAALRAQLEQRGRWEWLVEECRRAERCTRSGIVNADEAWLRVRGRGTLRAKGLVVLRALAAWREEVAKRQDRPRASVARDEALVEIARKAPMSVEALRGLRAVRSRELERGAADIVQRVVAALETPRAEWPQPAPVVHAAPAAGAVEVLQAVLRVRAEESGIAPTLVATSADLQELVRRRVTCAVLDELPILQGWRREIAGRDLLALLDGDAAVSLDPVTGAVRIETRRSPLQ
ncbi:MAG: ribonuclease D [Candidatus Binatia bacterium]